MTRNIYVECGLTNGVAGTLKHIHYETGQPSLLFIAFDHDNASILDSLQQYASICTEGIPIP